MFTPIIPPTAPEPSAIRRYTTTVVLKLNVEKASDEKV